MHKGAIKTSAIKSKHRTPFRSKAQVIQDGRVRGSVGAGWLALCPQILRGEKTRRCIQEASCHSSWDAKWTQGWEADPERPRTSSRGKASCLCSGDGGPRREHGLEGLAMASLPAGDTARLMKCGFFLSSLNRMATV